MEQFRADINKFTIQISVTYTYFKDTNFQTMLQLVVF